MLNLLQIFYTKKGMHVGQTVPQSPAGGKYDKNNKSYPRKKQEISSKGTISKVPFLQNYWKRTPLH